MFGAGFTLAFVFIYTIWFLGLPEILSDRYRLESDAPGPDETEIASPPKLSDTRRFLGSSGAYAESFLDNKTGALSSGDGKIIGSITVHKKPVQGVRIRLALNGSVLSQWATSGADGRYVIPVPYGEYRIDGYELDRGSAHKFLPDKINNPGNPHRSGSFTVGPENDGLGLALDFVEPIEVLEPTGNVSISEEIVLKWAPYPGASAYAIQIFESESAHQLPWNNGLFKWRERPRVSTPFFDLKAGGVKLKSGFYYMVDAKAEDEAGRIISETAISLQQKHFKIVD